MPRKTDVDYNHGLVTARRTSESDEQYTPSYAVKPLLKYLKPGMTIWCPFDLEDSQYVKIFTAEGYNVIHSHIFEGKDFFTYEPENYDVIISNGPFTLKDKILKRLFELNKPYAVLFPIPTLQGIARFPYMKDIQYLGFDKRINFYQDAEQTQIKKGIAFGCCYLCRHFLPKDLIIEELIV